MFQEDREKGGAGDLRMNEYKRVTRRPRNDGYPKSKFVMAVTSSEVGSVARYAHGRYGNTPQPFSVAAEAGRLKHQPGGLFWKGRMSDDEKLIVEACMNCKNYILGLCLHLDHWVEDDDWCAAWERSEQTVELPPAPHSPAEA